MSPKASDVYAFAVTLNELASGTFPFADCTKDNPAAHTVLDMGYGRLELAAAVAGEQLRPTLPHNAPPAWAALMAACWHADPAQRPTMAEVEATLAAMRADSATWQGAANGAAASAPATAEEGVADGAVAAQEAAVAAQEAAVKPLVEQAASEGLCEMLWERQCQTGCTPSMLCAAFATPGAQPAVQAPPLAESP